MANILPAHSREVDFDTAHRNPHSKQMKNVPESAQIEAAESNLQSVELCYPTPLIEALIEWIEIQYCEVVREEEGISCLLWNGEGKKGKGDNVEWIGNEKYAWC